MQKSISSFFDPTNVILIYRSILFLLKLSHIDRRADALLNFFIMPWCI